MYIVHCTIYNVHCTKRYTYDFCRRAGDRTLSSKDYCSVVICLRCRHIVDCWQRQHFRTNLLRAKMCKYSDEFDVFYLYRKMHIYNWHNQERAVMAICFFSLRSSYIFRIRIYINRVYGTSMVITLSHTLAEIIFQNMILIPIMLLGLLLLQCYTRE